MRVVPVAVSGILLLALSGCSFRHEKTRIAVSSQELSYANIRDQVLQPFQCTRCHGSDGGINLQSYAAVKLNIVAVKNTVLVLKTMPRGLAITAEAKDLLSRWIEAGAPEFAEPGREEALEPNFASIQVRLFEKSCVSCHSSTSPSTASRVPFAKIEDLVGQKAELVVPGVPEESRLILALNKDSEGLKCPEATERSPLPQAKVDVLKEWIRQGAPLDTAGQLPRIPSKYLSYEYARKTVLGPRCSGCHGEESEHIRLTNWAQVQGAIPAIYWATLVDGSMPPRPLSKFEANVIDRWVEAGAPETAGGKPSVSLGNEPSQLSFKLVKQKVLTPSCLDCHGEAGGEHLYLGDHASVRAKLTKVAVQAIALRTMPPQEPEPHDPLTQEQIDLLSQWVLTGAPEHAVEPNYASIRERILGPKKCLGCHASSPSAQEFPLEPYEAMIKSPRQVVTPGDLDNSGIWIFTAVVGDEDDHLMPPKKIGPRLPESELKILKEWIEKGAPAN